MRGGGLNARPVEHGLLSLEAGVLLPCCRSTYQVLEPGQTSQPSAKPGPVEVRTPSAVLERLAPEQGCSPVHLWGDLAPATHLLFTSMASPMHGSRLGGRGGPTAAAATARVQGFGLGFRV